MNPFMSSHYHQKMEALGLIPARAGSRGIPDKNITPLAGVSPLERAIRVALDSNVLQRVVVTTDSEKIAELARNAGAEVPFIRPPELATDEAPTLDVVRHALETLEAGGWSPDIVVLLQPTAPLRTAADIAQAVDLMRDGDSDSVVSVTEVPEGFNPHWMLAVENDRLVDIVDGGRETTRRQDLPKAYLRDGTVYATRASVIRKGSLYGNHMSPLVIPAERSVNLDTQDDWNRAEALLTQ